MLTNDDCTLYLWDNGAYRRVVVYGVHWEDTQGADISKTGSTGANTAEVYLPLSALPSGVSIRASGRDYIVRGVAMQDVDEDHSILDVAKSHALRTITGAVLCDFGSRDMQHWEVTAN